MKCKFCNKDKSREDFPKVLCGRCKECKYEYTRQWKEKNRDKVNKADKEWRYKNWDKYLESQRKTYYKFLDRNRKYGRELQKKLREKYGYTRRNGDLAKLPEDARCEECGIKNDLCVHHKDNKGRHNLNKGLKPNNNKNNLQILCRACHATLHARLRKVWQKDQKERPKGSGPLNKQEANSITKQGK